LLGIITEKEKKEERIGVRRWRKNNKNKYLSLKKKNKNQTDSTLPFNSGN
jgi:hypothetical protein